MLAILCLNLKQIFHNKKNIILILLLSLMFTAVLLNNSFKNSLNTYWNENVHKFIDYRTYVAIYDNKHFSQEYINEILNKNEHIVAFAPFSSYLISMTVKDNFVKNDNSLFLIGTIDNPLELSDGISFEEYDGSEYPIICSQQFYPYNERKKSDYLFSKTIDISNKINENLNLSFIGSTDNQEKFKLIGLYDSRKYNVEGNVCYTTFNVVEKLNKKYQSDVFFDNNANYKQLIIVIDDISNQQKVSDYMAKNGVFLSNPTLNIDPNLGDNMTNIIKVFSIVFSIFSALTMIIIFIKRYAKDKRNYILLKSYGYSNFKLFFLYFMELCVLVLLALLISLFLYYISVCIIYKLYMYDKVAFSTFKFKFNYIFLKNMMFGCFAVIIFLSIVHFILIKHSNLAAFIKNDKTNF